MSGKPETPETRREFEDRQFAEGELADIRHDQADAQHDKQFIRQGVTNDSTHHIEGGHLTRIATLERTISELHELMALLDARVDVLEELATAKRTP